MRELTRGRNATALLCAVAFLTAAFIAGGDSTAGAFGAKTPSLKRIATATLTATGLDGTAPTKPSRLRIEATTASTLTISWRRSTDRVGVAGYTVYRDGTRLGTSSASTLRYAVSGLACGRSYEIGVDAYDLAGNRSARATIVAPTSACTDTVAPSAPPSVTQVEVTATSIAVAWSPASDNVGVVGYDVLQQGALAGSTASTQYAVTSLQCGTMYTIGVRAFDASGNRSAAANVLLTTASCPDTAAPTAPTGLSLTGANESSVSVKWQPSTDATGVAGYSLYRDGNYAGSTSGTSYTVAGLSCGTSYVIAVEAYDAAGNRSARSSAPMATSACPPLAAPAPPADTTPPTTPTGLAATGATASSISLRWDPSSDASGVSGYGLYKDGAAAGSVALTNATFSGLTCGRSYTLSVDAYDASGNRSSRGSVVSSTAPCPDTTPPSMPTGLTQTGATESTIGLGWVASSDNVGVAGYGVYLGSVRVATTASPGYTFASLGCGTTYTVGVDAYDAAGSRSARASLVVTTRPCTADTQAPSVPQNQTVTGNTATSFTMSWGASTDDVGVTGYGVYLNGTKVTTTTATSYTYTNLACGTTYTVGLEALDAAGNTSDIAYASGPASTSACPASSDTQAPTAPAVTLGAVSQTSAAVLWSGSTDNVAVTSYGYYRGGSRIGNGTGSSYTFSGLTCGTSYTLGIDAADAAGNRSAASSVTATTSACSASPPPTSSAANLWVDTSGGSCVRQASPGGYSDAQACAWNQAYQASQTGDLILVKGGSYGDVKIGPNRTAISAPGVTFRTASGEQVIVDDFENGSYYNNGGGANNLSFIGPISARTFISDYTNNIVLDGWNVDCQGCVGVQIFHLDSDNITVRNSEIQDNTDAPLLWISGSNLSFENNRIHDAGLRAGSGAHTECMYAWDVTNLTLKRNHFYHCSVMDVFITGSAVANGGVVENNIFEKPWTSTGVISNSALAFHFRNGGDPSPDPNNWDFRNNTFVGPLSITSNENQPGSGGVRLTNNVFLSSAPSCGLANTSWSHNAFISGACGSNSITNTLSSYLAGFTNTSDPGTYTLAPTSVLRDKANPSNYPNTDINGTTRYTGTAPDIGADESS